MSNLSNKNSNNNCVSSDKNIAVIVPTYNREKSINNIVNTFLELDDYRIHLYIIDNARNFHYDCRPNLTVIPNINAGGAGGFARGMLEVLDSEEHFSHVVLMDDDISFDSKLFERLINFLKSLGPDSNECFVGGAMFRSDRPYFHVESGAKWNGLVVEPLGYGLDIREPQATKMIDSIFGADYAAWWFCCIPIKYIRDDNLPLPLFFQWDDVDYGLRNKAGVYTRSDIYVLHEPFDLKRTAMQYYYSNRNSLIVNSCHDGGDSKKTVIKTLKNRIISEICLYRYEYAESLNKSIEDFLKGPMWLCSINPEEYNNEILRFNKPFQFVANKVDYDWLGVCRNIKDCDFLHKFIRMVSLNGYLLKSKNDFILPLYTDKPVQGYRANKILFLEEISGMGFERNKDIKKAICCIFKFLFLYLKLLFCYSNVKRKYRDKYSYMTSNEMWKKYLRLNELN